MVRLLENSKLVFRSSLFSEWGSISNLEVVVSKNCCAPIGSWTINGPLSEETEPLWDVSLNGDAYVEYKIEGDYEIKGIRVLDTVTGTIHLIAADESLGIWASSSGRSYTVVDPPVPQLYEMIYATSSTYIEEKQLITGTGSYIRVYALEPVNWKLLGMVVADTMNECKFIPAVKAFHIDGIYISNDTITILPELLEQENLEDGIYSVKVNATLENDVIQTIQGCAFVDNNLKCDIVSYLIDNPKSNIYHLYLALKNAAACDSCGCQEMCDLYQIIYKEVYNTQFNKKTSVTNDCGCS